MSTCHPTRLALSTVKPRIRRIKRLGWRPDLPDSRDIRFRPKAIRLPASVDWRGSKFMPKVYDQGNLGSCVLNATGSAYAYLQEKSGMRQYMPARLFMYYETRRIEGTLTEDAGCEIRDAMKVIAKLGVPHEYLWPYDISKYTRQPRPKAYEDALLHQCIRYERVDVNETAVKLALAAEQMVVMGMTVYESFWDVGPDGVVKTPSNTEFVEGGHSMKYVGYEKLPISSRLYAITKNSWDDTWGDHGYCYVPFDYGCNPYFAGDFWTITEVERPT